jgi:hypothetical protein
VKLQSTGRVVESDPGIRLLDFAALEDTPASSSGLVQPDRQVSHTSTAVPGGGKWRGSLEGVDLWHTGWVLSFSLPRYISSSVRYSSGLCCAGDRKTPSELS